MIRVEVQDYREFSRNLKKAEPSIRRNVRKRIREAAVPLSKDVMREGAEDLPGDMPGRFAGAGGKVSQTATGIRFVIGRKGAYPAGPDRTGKIRHPLYGNREHWYSTPTKSGTWTQAFDRHKDEALDVVGKVLDDVAKEIM